MANLPQPAGVLRALATTGCLFLVVQACGRSDTQDYLYDSDGTISVGDSAGVSSGGSSVGDGGTRAVGGTIGRAGAGNMGATGNVAAIGNTAGTSPIGGSVSVGGSAPIGGSGIAGSSPIGGTGVGGSGPIGGTGVGGSGVAGSGTAGSGGVTGVPITCGNQTCDTKKQFCCATLGGFGCLAKNQMCGGAVLSCTNNADCPGADVCCLSLFGNAQMASSCKSTCNGMGPGRDRQLCQVDADCAFPNRFCRQTVFGVSVCTRG